MKTLKIVTYISELILLAGLAFGQTSSAANPNQDSMAGQQLTGTVGNSWCKGLNVYRGQTRSSCTRNCVARGADYILVVGPKVYTLEGHRAELDKVGGGRATVTGMVNGDRIAVDSVTEAK